MKKNKIWIIGIVIFAIVAFLFPKGISSKAHALQLATDSFKKVCKEENIAPSLYSGPIETTVEGAKWAFEWHSKEGGQKVKFSIIGIWIGHFGDDHLYFDSQR